MVNPYDVPPRLVGHEPPTAALMSSAGSPLPTIFGTINVVIGIVGLLSLVASAFYLAAGIDLWRGLQRQLVRLDDPGSLLQLLYPALSVASSLLLTLSGVGLLKKRKWGRVAALCYALPTAIWSAGSLAMQLSHQLRFIEHVSSFDEPASLLWIAFSAGLGCIWLAYPIVLAVFMFNRSLRAQLR